MAGAVPKTCPPGPPPLTPPPTPSASAQTPRMAHHELEPRLTERSFWREAALRLPPEILDFISAPASHQKQLVLNWIREGSEEDSSAEREDALVEYIASMRPRLLRRLVSQYVALKERDTDRNRRICEAADAFQRELALIQ